MNGKLRSVTLLVALALLLSGPGIRGVSAGSDPVTYEYLIGEEAPAIAMASNGDTIELTGEGTVGLHPKSVTGGGTFVHKDPDGNVLGSGTWTAEKLSSLHEYGCGGEGLPDDFCGGQMVAHVHLVSDAGLEFDATLWVDCLIGSTLAAGAAEGVRLSIHGGGPNFNKEVSGETLFILLSDGD